VETAIKLFVFAIPVSHVAQWCDVPPTWKSVAFLAFGIVWFGCVLGGKKGSATADDSSAGGDHRKAAKDVMTPAQVAEAARQLSKPKPER
jgi:hypothetical protein